MTDFYTFQARVAGVAVYINLLGMPLYRPCGTNILAFVAFSAVCWVMLYFVGQPKFGTSEVEDI